MSLVMGSNIASHPLKSCPDLMPESHYRRYAPRLENLLRGGTAYKDASYIPRFWCFRHTTAGIIGGCRHWVIHPCPSTTVGDSYAKLRHSGETSNTPTHLMSPYYTERRPSHYLIHTADHTLCSHSPAHAHGSEFRGGNCKRFKTSVRH